MQHCHIHHGNFLGFYGGGNHEKMFIEKWDHGTNQTIGGSYDDGWHAYEGNSILELEDWMGERISHHTNCGGGAEVIRWSVTPTSGRFARSAGSARQAISPREPT